MSGQQTSLANPVCGTSHTLVLCFRFLPHILACKMFNPTLSKTKLLGNIIVYNYLQMPQGNLIFVPLKPTSIHLFSQITNINP